MSDKNKISRMDHFSTSAWEQTMRGRTIWSLQIRRVRWHVTVCSTTLESLKYKLKFNHKDGRSTSWRDGESWHMTMEFSCYFFFIIEFTILAQSQCRGVLFATRVKYSALPRIVYRKYRRRTSRRGLPCIQWLSPFVTRHINAQLQQKWPSMVYHRTLQRCVNFSV